MYFNALYWKICIALLCLVFADPIKYTDSEVCDACENCKETGNVKQQRMEQVIWCKFLSLSLCLIILNIPPQSVWCPKTLYWLDFGLEIISLLWSVFDPIIESLNSLSSSGLKIETTTISSYIIYFKLVLATFDLPAKATVLNAKQFNGKYSRSICLHPGYRLSNNARIYRAVIENEVMMMLWKWGKKQREQEKWLKELLGCHLCHLC